MKPHQRKINEALYKLRRFKTFGAIFTYDPTSRFLFRMGHSGNPKNPNNIRATKAKRPEGRFQQLRAFKLAYNLV